MSAKHDAFKVGLVTLTVLAIFFIILIWISQTVEGDMQQVTFRFKSSPDMPTLASGSAVFVGGYRVGSVIGVELEKQDIPDPSADTNGEAFFLMVQVELRDDLVLRKDCKIIAEGPPLGGDGILKIDMGTATEEADMTQPIDGSEPGGLGAVLASLQSEFDDTDPTSLLGSIKSQLDPNSELSLMAKIHQSLSDVNNVTASIAGELEPGQKATLLAKLHEIVDHVNATTAVLQAELGKDKPEVLLSKLHLAMDTVTQGLETVTHMLKTNEAPITNTIQNVEAATGHIADETDPDKVDSLMAHFKKAGVTLNSSLEDIETVTQTTREVVLLNRENIHRLLINFKEASDHIKTGVKYVLRHPWRLLNEPSMTEMREQAIFDATRSFTEAATRIDDASAQLAALAEVHNGEIPLDNADLARIMQDLKETRGKYEKAEAALWRQLNVK